ncbi:hypothetical protein [Hydrogenivirga sp.]
MDWGQVITIIFGVAGFMGIFMFLINKRIDTLELSLNKRLDTIEKRIDKLEEDIRELRQLLYRALGEPSKKE